MNIFQMVGGVDSINQGVFSGILKYQHSWLKFKALIDRLFDAHVLDDTETRLQWGDILNNSRHLIKVALQYYTHNLDQLIYKVDSTEIKRVLQEGGEDKMEKIAIYLGNKFNPHRAFLTILSKSLKQEGRESGIETQLTSKLKGLLMEDLNIAEVLLEYFKSTHHKHSKSILQNSMLEFDQDIQEFIQEKVEGCAGNFDSKVVNRVVRLIVDLGMEDESLAMIMGWITEDLRSFVKRFEDSMDDTEANLLKCEIYFDSFHSSFLKMFGECLLEQVSFERKKAQEIWLLRSLENSRNKVYLAYGQSCVKNIFMIALTYPESQRLVKELKKCTDRECIQLSEICSYLSEGIEKRLLIPGVVTQTILLQYINMLKVLQVIDSTGQIHERITTPIKTYLLKRSDTLRCIINHLMTDQKELSYSRLGTQMVKLPSKEYCDVESDDDDYVQGPLSMDSERKPTVVKYQEIDLVTVLVNLYGSQESFIGEYQVMLAQKLMGAKEYDIDEEIINLERLKQRFGEQALQACNIIVKDFKDSKRTDNIINKAAHIIPACPIQPKDLHCTTVSKGYWPITYDNQVFNLPKMFAPVFNEYAEKFGKIKAMRRIQFHYDLGYVNIVLRFENESVSFKCLPIHAIIISYFDESKNPEKKVSVEFLAKELDLPQGVVRQKLSYWVHKGVIRPYLVLTSKQSISLKRLNSYEQASCEYYTTADVYKRPLNSEDVIEEADEMIIKEGSFQAKVKLAEGLINKILSFNGPKSAEQIYLLLKTVYRSQMNFDFTEAQTKEILRKMLVKHRVAFNGEVYSVSSSGKSD